MKLQPLSRKEIRAKLRLGKDFYVVTRRDRIAALDGKFWMGLNVQTQRDMEHAVWRVHFKKPEK